MYNHCVFDPIPISSPNAFAYCAPAQKLIEVGAVVDVERKDGVEVPRRFEDYVVTVHKDRVPKGVELMEMV
jgi:hypothetical protein